MDREKLSRLILLGCRKAQGQPAAAVHASIMEVIEIAEIMGGGSPTPETLMAPAPAPVPANLPTATPEAVVLQQDIPVLDVPVPLPDRTLDAPAEDVQPRRLYTTAQLIKLCQEQLPAKLKCKPSKMNREIELIRKVVSPPGGANGFPVNVVYYLDGTDEGCCPRVTLSPHQRFPNPDEIMRQIRESANAVFSSARREIKAERPERGMSIAEFDADLERATAGGGAGDTPSDSANESTLLDENCRIQTDRSEWSRYGS